MTVKELKAHLETLDDAMKVCVSAQYGGYHEVKEVEVVDVIPNPNFKHPRDREGQWDDATLRTEKAHSVEAVVIW